MLYGTKELAYERQEFIHGTCTESGNNQYVLAINHGQGWLQIKGSCYSCRNYFVILSILPYKNSISNCIKVHHKQCQAENNFLTHTSLCPNLRRLVPKFIARLPKRLMKAPTTHSPMNKICGTAKDTPHTAENFPPLPNRSQLSNSTHNTNQRWNINAFAAVVVTTK